MQSFSPGLGLNVVNVTVSYRRRWRNIDHRHTLLTLA